MWLEREGLIAPQPGDNNLFYFVTRRGKNLKNKADFHAYRKAKLLPSDQLHPTIAVKVRPLFIQGQYDTAVFEAFKQVEIAVRTAGGYEEDKLGTKLMEEAFNHHPKKKGLLTDTSRPEGEQKAMMFLFSGAIGLYKNPNSHRNVGNAPEEAADMIVIASHLLRTVDDVVASKQAQ